MKRTMEPELNDMMFVGNRLASSLDLVGPDKKTLRQKYIVGDPHDCPMGSAEDMKRRGFVGIYQRAPMIRLRLPNSSLTVRKTW